MYTLLGLLLPLLVVAVPVAGQTASLERCKYLNEQIEYFTKLRKGGGSARQMERWKVQRREYEDEFRIKHCHKYGRKLRDPT